MKESVVEVGRKTLEHSARILGPSRASAQALADADQHDGPVRFYAVRRSDGTGSIIVEKLPVGGTA